MPEFAHAGAHATDGMRNFPDDMRQLAVWSAERSRAAATASSHRGWAAAAAAAAAAACGERGMAARPGERAGGSRLVLERIVPEGGGRRRRGPFPERGV